MNVLLALWFGLLIGSVIGWFAGKSVYNWGYCGHHVEWWRGRDAVIDEWIEVETRKLTEANDE